MKSISNDYFRSHGNFIAASAAYMAFNWDAQGSNLAVLPLDTKGRQTKANIPLIFAHSDGLICILVRNIQTVVIIGSVIIYILLVVTHVK